jgi:hypothetical protein
VVGLLYFSRSCPNNVVKSQFDGQVHKQLLRDSKREWDDHERSFEVCEQDRPGGRWARMGRYRFSECEWDTNRFSLSPPSTSRTDGVAS